MRQYYVYILASKKHGTLYIGMTNDLVCRIWEHKQGIIDGFSKKYKTENLVYFETHQEAYLAIQREKQIKHWKREWKINLIQSRNDSIY